MRRLFFSDGVRAVVVRVGSGRHFEEVASGVKTSGKWQAERQKPETRNSKPVRTETGNWKFETGAHTQWHVARRRATGNSSRAHRYRLHSNGIDTSAQLPGAAAPARVTLQCRFAFMIEGDDRAYTLQATLQAKSDATC